MSEACQAFVHIPDWLRHIKDGRRWAVLREGWCSNVLEWHYPGPVAPAHPAGGGWVGRSRGLWVCLGVKPWHGDTLQSSAANVVNVNTKNEKAEREGCFPAQLGLHELIHYMAASERAFITGKKKKKRAFKIIGVIAF